MNDSYELDPETRWKVGSIDVVTDSNGPVGCVTAFRLEGIEAVFPLLCWSGVSWLQYHSN